MNVAKFIIIAMACVLSGCITPNGDTPAEKRDHIDALGKNTLAELYQEKPEAEEKIEGAHGYGVFDVTGSAYLLFGGTGNGYGVVVDKETETPHYMRFVKGTAGLGVGIKRSKMIIVFHNAKTYNKFLKNGWDIGIQGDAAMKGKKRGGEASGYGSFRRGLDVYQFTDKGVFLRTAIEGTMFGELKKLNK